MLLKCPECELQVSDKAHACPHCGYPMIPEPKTKRRPRQNRRKRLPNGFGQITEIKGKGLRRPFRAMVTVGKTENGRPICRLLKPEAYFETYNDAYAALIEYNRNPCDLSNDITMNELFNRWIVTHEKRLKNPISGRNIRYAWTHCKPIYDMKVVDVRARHMKTLIDETDTTNGNKIRMKMVFKQILDYAVEYEIVDHNYAKDFKAETIEPRKNTGSHNTFSDEELDILWEHVGESKYIDMILVQCYSGWRPTELCSLYKEDIDLSLRCMIGGSKTEAGRNRKVPIHPRIYNIIERCLTETDSKFLFGDMGYEQYRVCFHKVIDDLGLSDHSPHDCRVRFVTSAKESGLDEYAIKLIVGHTIADLTERVYTKRDFSWLLSEIEKIK